MAISTFETLPAYLSQLYAVLRLAHQYPEKPDICFAFRNRAQGLRFLHARLPHHVADEHFICLADIGNTGCASARRVAERLQQSGLGIGRFVFKIAFTYAH